MQAAHPGLEQRLMSRSSSNRKADTRFVIWSFFLAVLIHLLAMGAVTARFGAQSFYSENEQARIAWSLASGHGFSSPWPNTPFLPTAQQPPLYPWLLAAIFRLFGLYTLASFWATATINASLSGLTATLIYRAGVKHFDRCTALLATAGWLSLAIMVRFWESVLSALLVVLALLLLPENDNDQPSLFRWLALGTLTGVAMLSNTSLAAVFIPFLAWLWFRERQAGRASTGKMFAAVGVCFLILLPWTVRNYVVFHRLIPVRDNLGLELWVGNHEGVTWICDYGNQFPADHPEEYNRFGEIAFFEARGKVAVDFIRSHPGEFVHLFVQRVVYFWTAPPENSNYMTPVWALVAVLSMVGAVLAIKKKRKYAVPWLLALSLFPLVYYVAHPLAIYRHPIEPLILLTASYTLSVGLRAYFRAHPRGLPWLSQIFENTITSDDQPGDPLLNANNQAR